MPIPPGIFLNHLKGVFFPDKIVINNKMILQKSIILGNSLVKLISLIDSDIIINFYFLPSKHLITVKTVCQLRKML